MIARFFILLPFDLFIPETGEWPTLEIKSPEYYVRVHFPAIRAERPSPTDTVVGSLSWELNPPVFTGNLLVNGKKVAQVNVLALDFIKDEFDRADRQDAPVDPKPELAFEIANEVLARVRVYSRVHQIKALVIGRDPWRLRYLTEDGQDVPVEEGKLRGRSQGAVTVGVAALTPDAFQMVAARQETAEPYVWDQLLLDAHDLLTDVGGAIVMASAALETFITWALDVLEKEHPLPTGLWTWIKERDAEHWIKTPSVSEKFDTLLRVFTGRSLKEQPDLWRGFAELRKARNTLAHEGTAAAAGKTVDSAKATGLVRTAEQIIAWTELLLPEAHRRARIKADGPFSRRMATDEEADLLGRARVTSGQLGALRPGEVVGLSFEERPETATKAGAPKDPNPSGVG